MFIKVSVVCRSYTYLSKLISEGGGPPVGGGKSTTQTETRFRQKHSKNTGIVNYLFTISYKIRNFSRQVLFHKFLLLCLLFYCALDLLGGGTVMGIPV